jgi:hypothetical protein
MMQINGDAVAANYGVAGGSPATTLGLHWGDWPNTGAAAPATEFGLAKVLFWDYLNPNRTKMMLPQTAKGGSQLWQWWWRGGAINRLLFTDVSSGTPKFDVGSYFEVWGVKDDGV